MCTNLPQEITEDMLAVLFQQCVLGPDYALSGSPTVTPSGIKVSKQRKLLGLLHLGLVGPGQKWRRSFTKHQNWRRWQKERWTDSRSKKDGKCLLYTFEISLVSRYRLLLRFRGNERQSSLSLFLQSFENLFPDWSGRCGVLASDQAAIHNDLGLYTPWSLYFYYPVQQDSPPKVL